MKKLEKLNLKMPEAREAERLSHWLYEWSLLRDMPPGKDEESDLCSGNDSRDVLPEETIASYDLNIKAGQIRLMAPSAGAEMVFVVVVSVEPEEIGIVPFAPFTEPATPDELLSGRDSEVVRVYSLWNARKVLPAIAGNSWITDTLTIAEQKRLLSALDYIEHGNALPVDMRNEIGPPVIHPEDPRREYLYSERQRIDLAFLGKVNDSVIQYEIAGEKQELLKAAEEREQYNKPNDR